MESELGKLRKIRITKKSRSNDLDILGWRKAHGEDLPLLSKFNRSVLAIPSSSVERERVLIVCSNTVKEKWTHVMPQNVNGLIIIRNISRLISS